MNAAPKVGGESNFKTSVLNAYDPREHRLRIQNLVNTYDMANPGSGNKDMQSLVSAAANQTRVGTAAAGSRGARAQSLFSERPSNMPISPTKSMFFGGQSGASDSISSGGQLEDRKHRTQIKAELVRKELLSRSDLIKLY
jgi:hypothetical protein